MILNLENSNFLLDQVTKSLLYSLSFFDPKVHKIIQTNFAPLFKPRLLRQEALKQDSISLTNMQV